MSLPNGWRFEPGSKTACSNCRGTGKVDTPGRMVSPSGHVEQVFGFTRATAAEYAEIWAPEKCSDAKRLQLYGSVDPREARGELF